MRKIYFIFFSLILFVSCGIGNGNSAKKYLDKAAKGVDVPMEVDYMTTLVSCEFDGQDLIYEYEVDEDYASISELRENENIIREGIESNLEKPETQELQEKLREIGGKMIHKYIGNETGEVITIVIDMESVGKPKSDETKNQVGKVGKIGNLKLCR